MTTHLTQNQLLRPILQSPRFPFHLRTIQRYWDEEQRRREEFYDWITEDTRAEFINGEIIVQSPAKKWHTDAFFNLSHLMRTWVEINQLGFLGGETVLVTLTRNDYLPDICFYGVEKADQFHEKQMKFPAPDLVVEILSPSTEGKDRDVKFTDYAEHGVAEYWLIDPAAQAIEQYALQDDAYELVVKVKSGMIESGVIIGFEIPVAAVFDATIKNRTLVQMLT